jgi:hypothetical protein
METVQKKSTAHSYDAPAVVYEAALVAHAATTTVPPTVGCGLLGDVLDPTKGN